jgi:ribose transport system permease protein
MNRAQTPAEPGNKGAMPAGGTVASAADPLAAEVEKRRRVAERIARVGISALFVLMLIVFSILRPENFPTLDNAKAILEQAAILAVLGAGLTVVLVIKEFDLSFDANAAISGAFAVYVMTSWDLPMALGIVAGIAVGAIVGVANGSIVAYGKAPAFIGTLAVASVAVGVQSWFTDDQTIYGVPESYIGISTSRVLGIPLFIIISVAVVALVAVLLRRTVYGRHAHAVGSNVVAAASAGVRTNEVRFTAFVVLGALAGLAGVLITAQGGGSSPGATAGLLLPVYTAAFLGASAFGKGTFTATGTFFGVVFIGTLATGLTMLQQDAWVANVITGLVLVGAVLLARRQ